MFPHESHFSALNSLRLVNTGTAFAEGAHTVWGLDIAEQAVGLSYGGRPGAASGGVGGLLAVEEVSGSQAGEYVYFYDANGNVGQVLDWDAGTVAAHYQYDPFGREITATGTYGATNRFRFSTKHLDHETDLYYYGYRYYSPSMGRWLNRDPLGEEGGLNLYGFVGNNPVNHWDYLGLSDLTDRPPFDINDPITWPTPPDIKLPPTCGSKGCDVHVPIFPWPPNDPTPSINPPLPGKGECCVRGKIVDKVPLYQAEGMSLSDCIAMCIGMILNDPAGNYLPVAPTPIDIPLPVGNEIITTPIWYIGCRSRCNAKVCPE